MDSTHLYKAKEELVAGRALHDDARANQAGHKMIEHLLNAAEQLLLHIQDLNKQLVAVAGVADLLGGAK